MSTREALHKAEIEVANPLESRRIPHPYFFRLNKEGQLISEYNDQPIEEIIYKDNFLGRVEFEAFKKIQEHVSKNESGFIVWISPPYRGVYQDSKIIISEIVDRCGEKQLLNRAMVTGWDRVDSIIFAGEIAAVSPELNPFPYRSTSDVRIYPIFIENRGRVELLKIINSILDERTTSLIKSNDDFKIKEKYIKRFLTSGNKVSLGSFSISCPELWGKQTAFRVFSGETFDCPKCSGKIDSGKGITICPHCGAKKEDYGSLCEYVM